MPCNLQAAIAGLMAELRVTPFRVWPWKVVSTVGSCAMELYEPRQVREEAAVSRCLHVPRGCLARANYQGNAWKVELEAGVRYLKYLVIFSKPSLWQRVFLLIIKKCRKSFFNLELNNLEEFL